MENKMTFTVDRTTVTEGDVVEIQWNCLGADRVELKIDNGFKSSVLPLEISGTKRFRLNRSKGRTALTITAWKDGKHGSKTLKVRVNEMKTTRAETVDSHGRNIGFLQQWWRKVRPRWQSLPAEKRMAARILLILAVILLFTILSPAILLVGIAGLVVYLLYSLWKK